MQIGRYFHGWGSKNENVLFSRKVDVILEQYSPKAFVINLEANERFYASFDRPVV